MRAVRFDLEKLPGKKGARGRAPVFAGVLRSSLQALHRAKVRVNVRFDDELLEAKFRRCYWIEYRYRLVGVGVFWTIESLLRFWAGPPLPLRPPPQASHRVAACACTSWPPW